MKTIMSPALVIILLGCLAPWVAGDEPAELKVTRVALFSSGVGHFECDAKVAGTTSSELKFRTAQINDILKSLVVQDFDGGSISTVGYASRDPAEKTLKSFGVDLTGKPTLGQLLDQLRGEPVEIAGPRTIQGTIIGVEKRRIQVDKNTIENDVINVLTENGLQQMQISDIERIRLVNNKIDGELRKALDTLASSHDADKKKVVIHFEGQGERRVRASYLLEAPIWKTSYRLVLAPDKKPFLQGWATVENATEEDWKDIRLSLVSGRPISFIMDLYTPLYVPRPKEELELYASLRPPEYAGGGASLGRAMAEAPSSPAAAPAPARRVTKAAAGKARTEHAPVVGDGAEGAERQVAKGERMAGYGGFSLADNQTQTFFAMQDRDGEEMSRLGLAGEGVQSVAQAQQAGELFEYSIATPVSIARQHSAMLPIINEEIGGEKLSIYNPATHPKHPLNGLQIDNTSKLNLMQGPVTVFDENVYGGDSKLPDMKPGEKRLIAYALDLATEVTIDAKPRPDELISLRIAKGTLWHRHKYFEERTYNIRNKGKTPHTVILEQPYSPDWTLVEPKEPFERTGNLLRFKVIVPAEGTIAQKVAMERVGEEAVALGETGLDAIEFYLKTKVISPKVKESLEKVVALRSDLDRATRQRTDIEKSSDEAVKEQARIRENLKVLDKSSDAQQRQMKKFDQLETRIEQLREQLTQARQNEEQRRQALENYLLSIEVE